MTDQDVDQKVQREARIRELESEIHDARRVRFCYAMVHAEDQQAAAVEAGYAEKSARVQASRLRKLPEINELIRLLQEQVKEQAILTALDKRYLLAQIAQSAYKMCEFSPAVSAISELNRMDGDHAPTQHKVKGAIRHSHEVEKLTDEQLDSSIERLLAQADAPKH